MNKIINDGYEYLFNEIMKLKEEKDIGYCEEYIIYLKQKHFGNEDYYLEVTKLMWDYELDQYIWEDDWWEGEPYVELVGITPVDDLEKVEPLYKKEEN